jgi:hypothetical protein
MCPYSFHPPPPPPPPPPPRRQNPKITIMSSPGDPRITKSKKIKAGPAVVSQLVFFPPIQYSADQHDAVCIPTTLSILGHRVSAGGVGGVCVRQPLRRRPRRRQGASRQRARLRPRLRSHLVIYLRKIYIHTYIHTYIYIYIERERE